MDSHTSFNTWLALEPAVFRATLAENVEFLLEAMQAVSDEAAHWGDEATTIFFAGLADAVLAFSRSSRLVNASAEAALDGCYVIRTDVAEQVFDKHQAVACYRGLAEVERDFRQLKTLSIEIRPTYHHKDERIEAHVFLCMLAYYVQWHMRRRLAPLFEQDGEGADRRWTFAGVLERLKGIRQETLVFHNAEVTLKTTPDDEQQRILDLLDVRL